MGWAVITTVGEVDGCGVGGMVRITVGEIVGSLEGCLVGTSEGLPVGDKVEGT